MKKKTILLSGLFAIILFAGLVYAFDLHEIYPINQEIVVPTNDSMDIVAFHHTITNTTVLDWFVFTVHFENGEDQDCMVYSDGNYQCDTGGGLG